MALRATTLREKIEAFTTEYDGEQVHVSYRAGKCSPEWYDLLGTAAVRVVLSATISSWDVEGEDGRPLVPAPMGDASYNEDIISLRIKLEEAQRKLDAGEGGEPKDLSKKGLEAIRERPIEANEYESAFNSAWESILRTLPQPFLGHVLDALLEDVRPGPKAKKG